MLEIVKKIVILECFPHLNSLKDKDNIIQGWLHRITGNFEFQFVLLKTQSKLQAQDKISKLTVHKRATF